MNEVSVVHCQSWYFVCHLVAHDDTLEGGDWQLKLVGSTPHFPTRKNTIPVAPTGDELPAVITITPSLHTHKVIDYYLPDKDKKFLRLAHWCTKRFIVVQKGALIHSYRGLYL